MPHTHPVIGNDLHFVINPITREITNGSGKIKLMQYDHASEIFTFEIPRYVDGHDMSLCNKIGIHYINVGSASNSDVHIVTDAAIDENEDKVVFSWTIYGTATKYAGTLNFLIKFLCVENDGTIVYQWNTDIYKGIVISTGMDNEETIIEDNYDLLEQWKSSILSENPDISINDTAPSSSTTYSSEKIEREMESLKTGITRVESLDTENLVQLRDLETGLYVLYGYFSPYTDSHISMSFDNTMVVISKKNAGSHLLVFTGTNSKVNFLEIMVDSEAPAGYTYTRTDFVMMDMHNLIEKVGELADLNTTDKSSIVSAINEIVSNFVASEQFNQFKEELVTGKDAATENTKFAIGTAEQSLEIPSIEEFNQLKGDLVSLINNNDVKNYYNWFWVRIGHRQGMTYIHTASERLAKTLNSKKATRFIRIITSMQFVSKSMITMVFINRQ